MIDFTTPMPLADAVAHLSARTPIGSILRTAEWSQMPLALRQASQFSAGVESVRVMQAIQSRLMDAITLARNPVRADGSSPGTFRMNRQKFIADLREITRDFGLTPEDDKDIGTVRDITSEARLDLIYRTQTGQAHGHAFWKRGQDADVLNAWPAQELIRVRDSRVKRDWTSRWSNAGGAFPVGRMVALKTDPVWTAISTFGTPWPPFDFNSGMGVREIDREEAIALGLLNEGQSLEPVDEDFTKDMEASARGLNQDFRGALKNFFGDQVEIDGDTIKWKGGVTDESTARDIDESRTELNQTLARDSRDIGRAGQDVYQGLRSGDDGVALDPEGASAASAEIAAAALGRKPLYHEQWTPEVASDLAQSLREKLPPEVSIHAREGHLYVFRPETAARILGGSEQLLDRIHDLSVRNENGRLLGYGAPFGFRADLARVLIRDTETGQGVLSFNSDPARAAIFARDRARDYALATGREFDAQITYPGGGQ